jgi:MFS superfamily sulfate permease-like transporter
MKMARLLLRQHAGRTSRLLASASVQGFPTNYSSRACSTLLSRSFHRNLNAVLPAFATSNPGSMFKSTVTTNSDDEKKPVAQVKDAKFKSTTVVEATVIEPDDKTKTVSKKGKSLILDFGLPKLIPEWKKMFNSETLFQDISAGLTVGCIAVPLSLAIAVASGVPAEVGLVTAAVSGVAGGMMGGTTLAVTGPAAAISLLVVGAVEQHGLEALPVITLACGAMQLASGVTRFGVVAKLVPVSVIAGFTTGVGTLILTGQIPKALGMAAPTGMNPVELLGYIGENISLCNPAAASLALGTSAAMFLLPKIHPKMPSALLAVGGATLATHTFGLDVTLIGAIPSGLEAFQFGLPILPPMDSLPSLAATTFLIYSMTSVESLLSCAALEKMKKTSYKHNADQELIGQGLANMGSAMFMGMPVTSVIARSGLNVKLGAQTRLPAILQAGFVFSSVVFFSESISSIPMPALSGMLITTGMSMLNPGELKHCTAVQKSDYIPFVTTIGGMISFGLAEGIGIGCATAMMLHNGKLQAREVPLPQELFATNPNSKHATLWQLSGPLNFLSMFAIDDLMQKIQERKTAEPLDEIVFDMQGVTTVEFTGAEELVNRLVAIGDDDIEIQMLNCHDELQNALNECDPSQQIMRYPDVPASFAPALAAIGIDPQFDPLTATTTASPRVAGVKQGIKDDAQTNEKAAAPYWYDSPFWRPDV